MMSSQQPDDRSKTKSESSRLAPSANALPRQSFGKFELVRELGRGGMGVVFEARDTVLGRRVALKVQVRSISAVPHDAERFLREARSLASLQHPHVVAAYEADVLDEHFVIALELMADGSLQDDLKNGPLSVKTATEYLAQACHGLAAAHRAGVIHRDIKPSNLLRSTDGQVKLSDFGLARPHAASGETLTGSGSVLGTPQYMSPEQCRSERADERSDLYSLGATYFALLTGRPPYDRAAPLLVMNAHLLDPVPDPREVNPLIPRECAAIVQRAMAKDPDDRFATAEEMLAAIEQALLHIRAEGTEVSTITQQRLTSAARTTDAECRAAELTENTGTEIAQRGGHVTAEATNGASSTPPLTDLSWGRLKSRREVQASHTEFATEVDASLKQPRPRSRLSVVLWVCLLGVVALVGHELRQRSIDRPPFSVTADAMLPPVEVAHDGAQPVAAAPLNQPPQPIVAEQRRRLALPVANLPPDAFRLPEMKMNEIAKQDGREVWECPIAGITHVAVSHSGQFMITVARVDSEQTGFQSRIDVWQPDGRRALTETVPGRPLNVAISADSRRVVINTDAVRGALVFDSTSWQRIVLESLNDDSITAVALSDVGQWLAYATLRGSQPQFVLSDLTGQLEPRRIDIPERGSIRSIAFSSGPELVIATGGDGGQLRVWTGLPDKPESRSSSVWPSVQNLAFGPENNLLAVKTAQFVSFWKPEKLIRRTQIGLPTNRTTSCAYSPRGEQLAIAIDKWVRVVATDSNRSIANLRGFVEPVVSIAYLPDGSGLAVATADGTLHLSRGMTRTE